MILSLLTLSAALATPLQADPAVDLPLVLGAGSVWLSLYTQPGRQTLPDSTTEAPRGLDALAPTTLHEGVAGISDAVLYGSIGLGLGATALREDRADAVLLYAEALAVNGALTELAKHAVRRPRPYTLSGTALDADDNKSFFSGHTSFVAATAFTTARAWDLEHDLSGGQRALAYGLAAWLTAGTGAMRVAAAKHFPSDVITGAMVGGAVGWLVPELHRHEGVSLTADLRQVRVAGRF
ncbi:MAG: phosphatase PAP2 family protein [Deltaproteobacteria bacterium]|nr:phosphatase PAP2 family protein [Deltaproteobacteria bacterium]